MDKDNKRGGSFTSSAMFKKWYRMGLIGIFHFMFVNGQQAWNMMSAIMEDCIQLDNSSFRWGSAEEML